MVWAPGALCSHGSFFSFFLIVPRTIAKYVFDRSFTVKQLTMFGPVGVHLSTKRKNKGKSKKMSIL